jgi:hypothetical protein
MPLREASVWELREREERMEDRRLEAEELEERLLLPHAHFLGFSRRIKGSISFVFSSVIPSVRSILS